MTLLQSSGSIASYEPLAWKRSRYYSGRKKRDGQKNKIGIANKKKEREKVKKKVKK